MTDAESAATSQGGGRGRDGSLRCASFFRSPMSFRSLVAVAVLVCGCAEGGGDEAKLAAAGDASSTGVDAGALDARRPVDDARVIADSSGVDSSRDGSTRVDSSSPRDADAAPTPDAARPDAEEPLPEGCTTSPVEPWSGPACSRATAICWDEAMSREEQDECVVADAHALRCVDCLERQTTSCANAHGCQRTWDVYQCCLDGGGGCQGEHRAYARCVESYTGPCRDTILSCLPSAGDPEPECTPHGVPIDEDARPCGLDTSSCLTSASGSAAIEACFDDDRAPFECRRCVVARQQKCIIESKCQAEWDALACCIEAHGELACGTERAALTTCTSEESSETRICSYPSRLGFFAFACGE